MIIKIKNLRLKTIIGVYDWEKEINREIIINLEIKTDHLKSTISDDLLDAINYDEIVQKITNFIKKTKFNLIEKLAREIMNLVMEDQRIKECKIEVDKVQALANIDSFSVILEEKR